MLALFVTLYLVATVTIGFYSTKFIKNTGDFVNAGRGLPFVFNSFALFALWFGAETVFGASGRFIEGGLLGVIEDPLGSAFCLILFGLFLARPLYRRNILTIGDLFKNAYGRKIELISAALMVFTFFGFIAAQLVALSISLKLIFGFTLTTGILISSLVVTLYTFTGGMWAISISDFMQSIIIILGLGILAFMLVSQVGGVEAVIAKAPENHFQFFPNATAHDIDEWVSAWCVIGLGSLASQDIFQRVNSARNIKSAVYSTYVGAGMYILFSIFPLTIALCARILYPEIMNPDNGFDLQEVVPQLIMGHMPMFVQIFFFGALVSAILSTCSGALLAPSTILAENIIKPLWQSRTDRKLHLWTVRLSIIIMSLVSTGMALVETDIYRLVGDSGIVALVSILVPTFAAIYHKKPSRMGALWAMFFGLFIWFMREKAGDIAGWLSFDWWKGFFTWYSEIPVSAWIIGPIGSLVGYYIGWAIEVCFIKTPVLPDEADNDGQTQVDEVVNEIHVPH